MTLREQYNWCSFINLWNNILSMKMSPHYCQDKVQSIFMWILEAHHGTSASQPSRTSCSFSTGQSTSLLLHLYASVYTIPLASIAIYMSTFSDYLLLILQDLSSLSLLYRVHEMAILHASPACHNS